ncbi:hypothetical protein SRHO_G00260960 [Serrasalmus rhombeus]
MGMAKRRSCSCLQDTQTGTECRISAGLKDCIQKRGRTCLKRRDKTNEEDAEQNRGKNNRGKNKRNNGDMQEEEVESTCSK